MCVLNLTHCVVTLLFLIYTFMLVLCFHNVSCCVVVCGCVLLSFHLFCCFHWLGFMFSSYVLICFCYFMFRGCVVWSHYVLTCVVFAAVCRALCFLFCFVRLHFCVIACACCFWCFYCNIKCCCCVVVVLVLSYVACFVIVRVVCVLI